MFRTGVRWIRGAMRACAARIACQLGGLVAGSFDGWGGVHETHFGLGNGGRFFTFSAPFYNAFVAAVKEAFMACR